MNQFKEMAENCTALDLACYGFSIEPSVQLQQAMEKIVPNMQDLPFYRSDVSCFCPKFTLFEGQWLGAVLTPWTLSLVILPGPNQYWENRVIGEKILLQLPYKNLVFTVSHLEDVPQYLSCSLLSPLDPTLTAEELIKLTKDCLYMMLSLPVKQTQLDEKKRNIFRALME